MPCFSSLRPLLLGLLLVPACSGQPDRGADPGPERLPHEQATALIDAADADETQGRWLEALARRRAAALLEPESDRALVAGLAAQASRPLCHLVRASAADALLGLSDDGARLLLSAGGAVELWSLETGAGRRLDPGSEPLPLPAHAAFSASGATVAVAYGDRVTRVYDATSGALVRGFSGASWPGAMALSSDGRQLRVASSTPPLVRGWDLRTGLLAHAVEAAPSGLRFTDDGRSFLTVVTGASGPAVAVVDAATGLRRRTLPGAVDGAVTVSADGMWVAACRRDRPRLWNVATGQEQRLGAHDGTGCEAPELFDEGRALIVRTAAERLHVWDTGSGSLSARIETAAPITAFGVTGTPPRLVVAAGREVTLHERSGARVHELGGSVGQVHALAGSSARVVLAGTEGVWACEAASPFDLGAVDVGRAHGASLALSGDGSTLTLAGPGGAFEAWTASGARLPLRAPAGVGQLALSLDGRRVAVVAAGELAVVDTSTGATLRTLGPAPATAVAATFAPDGRHLVVAHDGALTVWDVGTGRRLGELAELGDGLGEFTVAPSGVHLVTAEGTRLRLWKLGNTRVARELSTASPARALAITHDGARVAAACEDGVIRVWRSDGATVPERELRGLPAATFVRFSFDGEALVAGAPDGAVRTWDVQRGVLTHALSQAAAGPMLQFTDDRRTLLGGPGSPAHRWDMQTGAVVQRLPGEHIVATPDGRVAATYLGGTTGLGQVLLWSTPPTHAGRLIRVAGGRSNLRVCESDLRVVPVLPYPAPETVWAPAASCR